MNERDEQGRKRKGTWSQAYTGLQFWVVDPRADEVTFDDVCIGLARASRYRGQTREYYSVAEHSVIVSLFAEKLARERSFTTWGVKEIARAALLHDASEAYIGDVARPLKNHRSMKGYKKVEKLWEKVIAEHFHLVDIPGGEELIKEVDNRIVLDEVEALFLDPDMWFRYGRYRAFQPLGAQIAALSWQHAAAAFCQRFAELFPLYPEREKDARATWVFPDDLPVTPRLTPKRNLGGSM
jgi:5'-deoxynucleotidase YfbR-like HD superfamily hydrolase